jgi:hypothetical protein
VKTKERLAAVLREAGLLDMALKAADGAYDDFESDSAMPIRNLVRDLEAAGRPDLAQRAKLGEWDGTKEEAEAWWAQYRREHPDLAL